ncbi:LysR family transcriptional regulator [Actinomadura darangshiensis]|uniref:LysR family transcriptional regulator n=1 Tax=Actinomadura darangshiensis TaxID=705336 RepID=A0A4R5BMV6_9ACTN|nr:LysR family transcriptional regulator [Actinomadura darangshiensis]TDD86676.1 LysR family transcriptional regulator [Actinomadura darangshiensis]
MIDHRLQTLRVLRERGTVTATAEALHLTPSTVSQQLRQLARDLGVELLEAQGRRVRLTAAAHTVLRHADVLSAQWERARADLAGHRAGTSGRLRFCAVSSALAALVAPAAARLRERHPGLAVHMSEKESEDAAHLLLARHCDIAVVIPSEQTPAPGDARFAQSPVLDEPQDLLVPAGHPLAGHAVARLADAAAQPWIGSPGRPDQHQLMLAACAAAGYTPRIAHEANEWFAVSALVARGFGVGLVPRLAPLPPGDDVVRVPLHGEAVPSRRIVAIVRRGSEEQPPIARGLEALREAAAR